MSKLVTVFIGGLTANDSISSIQDLFNSIFLAEGGSLIPSSALRLVCNERTGKCRGFAFCEVTLKAYWTLKKNPLFLNGNYLEIQPAKTKFDQNINEQKSSVIIKYRISNHNFIEKGSVVIKRISKIADCLIELISNYNDLVLLGCNYTIPDKILQGGIKNKWPNNYTSILRLLFISPAEAKKFCTSKAIITVDNQTILRLIEGPPQDKEKSILLEDASRWKRHTCRKQANSNSNHKFINFFRRLKNEACSLCNALDRSRKLDQRTSNYHLTYTKPLSYSNWEVEGFSN